MSAKRIILGDSLSIGMHKFMPGVVNLAKTGASTAWMAKVMREAVDAMNKIASESGQPSTDRLGIVHIMGGTNDIAGGVPIAQILGNLGEIAANVMKLGGIPVVSTIPDLRGHDMDVIALNEEIVRQAKLGSWRLSQAGDHIAYGPDGVHPATLDGYRDGARVAVAAMDAAESSRASADGGGSAVPIVLGLGLAALAGYYLLKE